VKSLKICYVHEESPFSGHACAGIARYVGTMAVEMAQRGHQVYVVARNARGQSISFPEGALYELSPMRGAWENLAVSAARPAVVREIVALLAHGVAVFRTLRKLEAAEGLDVVVFADWRAEGICVSFRPIKAKWIVRLHAPTVMVAYANGWAWGPKLRVINALERHMCEKADLLTSPSRAMAAFARERMPLRSAKPVVIPNPVDTDHFRPMPEVDKEPFTVLCVGRIEPFKGSDVVAEAMRLVWKKVPEAKLYFAGGINEWNRSWAQKFKREWESDPRVIFLGLIDRKDLPYLYNRAAVLVVPSRYESFGYSCAEGMSCGLPVIASNVGSLPELIEHGRDGLLFPVCDAECLAEHLVELLRDGDLRHRLGLRAREKMLDQFASPIVASSMESIYRTVVGLRT